jgi:hypothetical protein
MYPIKRRIYIINPRFQLRWTLVIALVGGLIATAFSGWLWSALDEHDVLIKASIKADQELRNASEDVAVLLLNMPETTSKEADELHARLDTQGQSSRTSVVAKNALLARNQHMRELLIVFVALIVVALFVWGVFVTHRIAGPLYVIKKQLEAYRSTGTVAPRPIRRHDEFHDLYDELMQALGGKAP